MTNVEPNCNEPRLSPLLITSEVDLYAFLIRVAKERSPTELYPKSVVDFAKFIVGTVPDGLNLEEAKSADIGDSLLHVALRGTAEEERQAFHPVLIEVAARLYEQTVDLVAFAHANRILISALGCNYLFYTHRTEDRVFFMSRPEFEDEFGAEVCIPQVIIHGDIRTLRARPDWISEE